MTHSRSFAIWALAVLALSVPVASRAQVAQSKQPQREVLYVAEQMPQFPGGEEALIDTIAKHLRYPRPSLENRTQGIVMARFVMTETGQVGDVQILHSLDPYCDREVMRVLKTLPAFRPGRDRGQSVAVWYTVPVRFKLPDNVNPFK